LSEHAVRARTLRFAQLSAAILAEGEFL